MYGMLFLFHWVYIGYTNAPMKCRYLCTVNQTIRSLIGGVFYVSYLKKLCKMKNEIQKFESGLFGQLRGMNIGGEAWLMATDVARRLGYTNPQKAIRDHVDDEDKTLNDSFTVNGTIPVLINESGLYSLILSSKLPRAREFKRWVTSEVLPQIRRTGGYIPLAAEDDDKTILAKAVRILNRTLEQKDELLEAQRPKVEFADAVTTGDGCILMSELAKLLTRNGYPTGRTRLFRWMRENGYIFKRSTEPIQKWVEAGLFATSVAVIKTHHGTEERVTTKVTGKGQEYFLRMLSVEC